ncbi:MAG: Uma2 family endonuclease [Chloroflexaceae bacterium]|nr:Uma2 family endonuclease [Chloroflexaceae bacterium]NJO05343.1 Uma2 family endonuclease [Chloroflexaceae bacterium]
MSSLPNLPDAVLAGPPQGQWTVADVVSFAPEEDGNRYELIAGVLHVTTQPHTDHQWIVARVTLALGQWSIETGAGEVYTAPGVIFSPHSAVAPDVVWVRRQRVATIDRDGKLYGAPDLAVEVLSAGAKNIERDRISKLDLYQQHDVPEYWIIDRFQHQIEAYRRTAGTLVLAQVYGPADTLTSPLLPGFACPVSRLFR